jgi:hypothetical protein
MRPKLVLLLVLALGAVASSAYIIMKRGNEKIACQKKCGCKKPPVVEQPGGGGDDLFNASFNHLIVSTIK